MMGKWLAQYKDEQPQEPIGKRRAKAPILRVIKSQSKAILNGWTLIKVWSKVFDEYVYFAKDEAHTQRVTGAVVYTREELRQVVEGADRETLRQIHQAKKIFGGKLVAKEGEEWEQQSLRV